MDFAERYRSFLKKHLVAAHDASGQTEISCKCKYCADGKDPRHGHMYISIPKAEDDISWFYCQKCHSFGIVDNKTLIEWGMYDPEIAQNLLTINMKARSHGKTRGFERQVYNLSNFIGDVKLAQTKMDYINSRLETNISIQQALGDKIIFNLAEVLRYNKISQFTRHPNIIDQLNKYFVGFLSFDNNFVNLRRICEEKIVYESVDNRYINYNIHDKKINTEKFYVSPANLDASRPKRIDIHIAEGPFDIMSIKYNLRRDNDAIYTAIGGSAYKGLLMYLIVTMNLYYINVHVYPDNDKSGNEYVMNDLAEFLRPFNIPLYIHRNTFPGQKDFGVCLNKINETIVKI